MKSYTGKSISMPPAPQTKPQEQNWEKDFDLSFDYLWQHSDEQQTTQHEAVKSFIRSLLQTQRDEAYEEGLKEQARIEKVGIEEIRAEAIQEGYNRGRLKCLEQHDYCYKPDFEAELKEKIIEVIKEMEIKGFKEQEVWVKDKNYDLFSKAGFNKAISEAIEIIKKIR